MTDDRLAAYLEEVRIRARLAAPGMFKSSALESAGDVPRLLAAIEGVLDLHQRGRSVILGALCPRHKSHRYFSITRTEAADVVACQACEATVYDSCTGCGPQMWQMSLGSCPARTAISAALLGEEESDAQN